jgi:hypothetical protein
LCWELEIVGLRGGREKTHGSSPSTSGKTNEKPSEIQTRRRQCTIGPGLSLSLTGAARPCDIFGPVPPLVPPLCCYLRTVNLTAAVNKRNRKAAVRLTVLR